jgi:hypothetical protein
MSIKPPKGTTHYKETLDEGRKRVLLIAASILAARWRSTTVAHRFPQP